MRGNVTQEVYHGFAFGSFVLDWVDGLGIMNETLAVESY